MLLRLATAVGLVALSVSTARAAGPYRVADINSAPPVFDGYPTGGIVQVESLGNRALFFTTQRHPIPDGYGDRLETGLWTSDGTPAGTRLVSVFDGIADSQSIYFAGTVGGVALMVVGDALWATDGTLDGTRSLLPAAVTARLVSGIRAEVLPGGRLLFVGCDGLRCRPWSTDGSPAGTGPLADVPPPDAVPLVALGGRLYWLGSGALVSSDGTPQGTRVVIDLGNASSPRELVATGEGLFFLRGVRLTSLWRSDGTREGTRLVRRLGAAFNLVGTAHRVYFAISAGRDNHFALATSDGTAVGTRVLSRSFDIADSALQMRVVGSVGDRLLFSPAKSLLWSSDGSVAGTRPLTACPGGCPTVGWPADLGGSEVLFVGVRADTGYELWTSDATSAGTRLVADLCPGPCDSSPSLLEERLGGRWLIETWAGDGEELWLSDLSAGGTRRLLVGERQLVLARLGAGILVAATDPAGHLRLRRFDEQGLLLDSFELPVAESRSSSPTSFAALGERVVFAACNATGTAAFVSDGSEPGTVALEPALEYCLPGYSVGGMVRLADAIYYTVDFRLHRTDGTPEGTAAIPLDALVVLMREFRGRLLIFGATSETEVRAFVSDGSPEGMHLLDAPPLRQVCDATVVGERLYFTASEPAADGGWRGGLYVISDPDGTPLRILDLGDYYLCGDDQVVARGDDVFFRVGGGVWRTDGTAAGTQVLLPAVGSSAASPASPIAAFGGYLFYLGIPPGGDAVEGTRLYRSNGTVVGTVKLAEAGDLSYDRTPPRFTAAGNHLFFRASDLEHGDELWVTDGSAAGTRLVVDLVPGPGSSQPRPLLAVGSRLYFAADDGEHGVELWSTDGTAAGTRMVADIAPLGFSSWPSDLTIAGDRLFFSADDGSSGAELWALPLEP